MTTIAANRKVMAADSRVSGGGPMYHCDKIFKIGGSIVGVAGTVAHTTKWLAWFRRECPPDEAPMEFDDGESFAALVLNDRGLFYYANCVEPDQLHERCYAIGTGAMAASAAMVLGKTPQEAVKLAMRLDEGTGGPIKELSLEPVAKKPRKKRTPKVLEAPPTQP